MSVILVAVSGKAGHGKDSLCDMMQENIVGSPTRIETVKYADPLKDFAVNLFNLSRHQVDDQNGKIEPIEELGGITPREILQKIGTDIARNIYEDIWVYKYNNTIAGLAHFVLSSTVKKNLIIFTPDMRFKNEYDNYDMYKEKYNIDVIRIRVDSPNFNIKQNNHPSETALDDIHTWDFIFSADSLDELRDRSIIACQRIKKMLD